MKRKPAQRDNGVPERVPLAHYIEDDLDDVAAVAFEMKFRIAVEAYADRHSAFEDYCAERDAA